MCHFTLELHLILNYFSASSLRKGQFKEAPGMMLTSPPIKDSQDVWNKYMVQIWPILSEFFPSSLLNSRSGKSPKNISVLRRLSRLLGPRNTVNELLQHASEVPKPQCPLREAWTQHRWKQQVCWEWHQNISMKSATEGQFPCLAPVHSSLQFNQLAATLWEHASIYQRYLGRFIQAEQKHALHWLHLWLVLKLTN